MFYSLATQAASVGLFRVQKHFLERLNDHLQNLHVGNLRLVFQVLMCVCVGVMIVCCGVN